MNRTEMARVAQMSRNQNSHDQQHDAQSAQAAQIDAPAVTLAASNLASTTAAAETAHLTSREAPGTKPRVSVAALSLGVWCGGAILGMAWTVVGLRRLAWIQKRAARVPNWVAVEAARVAAGFNLGRAFEIRQTEDLQSPCLVGLWRPVIFLPARQCDPEYRDELTSILAHELAHLKGGDLYWNVFLQGLTILLWFHPLAWRVRTTHADACDAVCDALAAGYVGDATIYSRILARLTLRITAGCESAGLAMARTSCISRRIAAVRGRILCAALPGRRVACAVIVATAAIVALGGLAFTPSYAEPSPPSVAQTSPPEKKSQTPATADKQPKTVVKEEPAGAADEPGIVTGELVEAEGGAPVAGARILLRDRMKYTATSDDRGQFRFEKIPPGQYAIWAHKDNLISPKERLVGRESVDSAFGIFHQIHMTMKAGYQVRLNVRSAVTSQPVEGADVRLGYPDRRQTTTLKDGTAILPGLLPEKYQLTIQAAGHARMDEEIDLSTADLVTGRSYSLAAGGVVRGTVVDESGQPLPEVDVTYWAAGTPVGFGGELPQTDAKGQFAHLYLPLQTGVKVLVRKPDYMSLEKEFTLTDRQPEQHLELRLQRRPRGGSIAGTVLDSDGKPIAGAIVRNFGNDPNQKREAKTDAKGQFVLDDLLKGLNGHEITVRARKFATVRETVEPGSEKSPARITVRLEAGHSIHGRVLNRSGEPLKGAYVAANGFGDWEIGETVRTNDDGAFAFDSLPTGSKFTVQASGYPVIHDLPLALDAEQVVNVTLDATVMLRGRVVDADTGEALGNFRIRGGFSKQRLATDGKGSYPNALEGRGIMFQSKEGAFVINDVTKGVPLELSVEADGYERQVFDRVVPETAEADQVVKVSLKKRDVSKLAKLAGTIIDHRGKPVADVQLRLIVSSEPSNGEDDNRFNWALIKTGQLAGKSYVDQFVSTVTDAQGAFKFDDLIPGKFLQVVFWGSKSPKGRSLAFAKTKPGVAQSIVIELPEPASIRVSFDAASFGKAGSIHLASRDSAFDDSNSKEIAGQTEFKFENLPPGRYQVSILARPERHKDNPQLSSIRPLAHRILTVEPGESYDVKFTAADAVEERLK